MPILYSCRRCDFSYISPFGHPERGMTPTWLESTCGECGDLCPWLIRSGIGPEEGELVRRVRVGEVLHPGYLPKLEEIVPRGPGRAAARRGLRTPEQQSQVEGARRQAWLAETLEVRDDDVLAEARRDAEHLLRLEPHDALACRACGKPGTLKLFLYPQEQCPRCHQAVLKDDGFVEP